MSGLFLAGCRRYAEFTLPLAAGGDASLTFRFEELQEPVLTRGTFSDVLNPSVTLSSGGSADGMLSNLYSVFDGRTWHTARAVSADGIHWERQGVVLSPDRKTWESDYMAGNGSALWNGGQLWYWYEGGPKDKLRIGLAREGPAHSWRKEPAPVLDLGPVGSWDERAVADPYVIRMDPYFFMYYLGQDRARRQRLGLARSKDGIVWEKLRSNPILEMDDEAGLGEPAVWNSSGFYWMLYTARDTAENRRLALARSIDGVHWKKLPGMFAGSRPWDSKVICDATVLVDGETVRVWFGGGDVASPDENLHGQIGYAILKRMTAP